MAMSLQDELTRIREAAAFAGLPERALLRISGSDATRWLNGMVTNSVQALGPGEGCYNFLLSAQGRIQGDCTLYREVSVPGAAPEFLLSTTGAQIDTIQQHLERFIIMDDVELTPAYSDEASLLLLGSAAPGALAALDLPELSPLRLAHAGTPHGAVLLLTTWSQAAAHEMSRAVPRYELRAAAATVAALRAHLLDSGIAEVSAEAVESQRILEGTPRFGQDIRDRDLPQETGQSQALHFAKGCYLGQEIVERIRSRGQVHRTLVQFRLQSLNGDMTTLPALPTALEAAGKPAGELTSAAVIPLPGGPVLLALGYARRELLETRQKLTYPEGAAEPIARGAGEATARSAAEPLPTSAAEPLPVASKT